MPKTIVMGRILPFLMVCLFLLAPPARGGGGPTPRSRAGGPDFNGDGFADLAVGAPGESVNVAGTNYGYAGIVDVVYGSSSGLVAAGVQEIAQDFGSKGTVAGGESFGSAVVAGDFNADGYADLAVGAPGEDVGPGPQVDAGAVSVLYGSASGLSGSGDGFFTELGSPESGDGFGSSLAVGDFDGDGYADLAVGAPGEDIGPHPDAGAVEVLRGSAAGLTESGATVWTQNSAGVLGRAGSLERFGEALAAGNLGKGPEEDLAIGVPGQNVGRAPAAGSVAVLYGSAGGLAAAGNQLWDQDRAGVPDQSEAGDNFGAALAVGDLGKGPAEDLAVGAPQDDLGSAGGAGVLNVIYGSPTGLRGKGAQAFSELTPGIPGDPAGDDQLGGALSIGNFGRGGGDDLAVGLPGKLLGAQTSAGAVIVIYAGTGGLRATGAQLWTQDSPNVKDRSEYGDRLGAALAAADYGGGAFADLAIGVPGEYVGTTVSAGVVNVLYGTRRGLRSGGNQLWRQGANLPGSPEAGDSTGAALAAAGA